jgi:hypothetical protein
MERRLPFSRQLFWAIGLLVEAGSRVRSELDGRALSLTFEVIV